MLRILVKDGLFQLGVGVFIVLLFLLLLVRFGILRLLLF